jgi:hypothetical protein
VIHRYLPQFAVLLAVGTALAASASAGVVVLANRTEAKIDFATVSTDGSQQRHSLAARDVLPIPAVEKVGVIFDSGGVSHRYLLRANSVQFFLSQDNKADLIHVALPGNEDRPPPASPAETGPPAGALCVVPVKLLVDQHEAAVQRVWEARFRERLKEASDIFEQCCRVRFEVVALGAWTANDALNTFDKSLRDFESKVSPAPAALAIGFTGLYQHTEGRTHLGGTRGPLHPYVLLREWSSRVSKAERLEVLIHELGHFLGAVHCPEYDSVMRPNLGDRRSNSKQFRIGFDPLNTFAMYLIGEELRSRRLLNLAQLQPATKIDLRAAYKALAQAMPGDPAAPQYLELLDRPTFVQPVPAQHPKPLVEAARVVLRAITAAAKENARQPTSPTATGGQRLDGDHLCELYVRRAAAAADALHSDLSPRAFLLGLGIAIDHRSALCNMPITSELCRQVESSAEQAERRAVLGTPTMHARGNLAEHFAVSAALAVLAGPQATESAGVAQDLIYSELGRGVNFANVSADVAGTTFAMQVLVEKLALAKLATSFAVHDFMPETTNLPEAIPWKSFLETYGSAEDPRFAREKQILRQRVLALPGYKSE